MVFDIRKHCRGLNETAASRRVGVRHSLAPLVPPKKTIEKKNNIRYALFCTSSRKRCLFKRYKREL